MRYQALSQTSYQFTQTTTIDGTAGIDIPLVANLPRIKAIYTSDSSVHYFPVVPLNDGTNNSSCSILTGSTNITATAQVSASIATLKQYMGIALPASVTIEGTEYFGYKNARYGCVVGVVSSSSQSTPEMSIPSAHVTVVKYSASGNTVITESFDTTASTIAQRAYSSGTVYITFINLLVNKASDDIILGLYIDYTE